MSSRRKIPSLDEHYCQICSTANLRTKTPCLACFNCNHCNLAMCYECFERHTSQLVGEYTQLQNRFSQLANLFEDKRKFLQQFQDNCIRSVNAVFDEALHDLENLRYESINYVRKQFNDADVSSLKFNKSLLSNFPRRSCRISCRICYQSSRKHSRIGRGMAFPRMSCWNSNPNRNK